MIQYLVLIWMFVAWLAPGSVAAQDVRPTAAQLARVLAANPDNHAARWAYAQTAFQAGRYDEARYHIRQLLRAALSDRDAATFTAALAEIDRADPWDVQLRFAILPSTNVRRSTFNDQFATVLGTFVPAGGGVEESGVGVTIGAGLAYSIGLTDQSRLSFRARVDRSQYDASDLNQTSVRFGVQSQTYNVGRTTTAEPFVRFQFDSSGKEERRYVGASFANTWWLSQDGTATAAFTYEDITNFESSSLSGPRAKIALQYSTALNQRTRMSVGAELLTFSPSLAYQAYSSIEVNGELKRAYDGFGHVAIYGSYKERDYDDVFPFTTLVREDRISVLGLSFLATDLDIYGARPRVFCQREVGSSNIDLYDFRSVDCGLTFERSF